MGSENRRIIWTPQPKQRIFLERPEYEVLYGGAAGGGKSDAAVMIPLMQIHIPNFKALILRKTYKQLSELIEKTQTYYRAAFPGAKYNKTEHTWYFPSGAKIVFGSMQHPDDRHNYQGHQYDVIIFDELTHFTWEEYNYMFSRNRPSGPGTFVCMRATTNPGGVGHGWVKKRFITPAPPLTPINETVEVRDRAGEIRTFERARIYVPATVFDNEELLRNDPAYLANLSMLPEAEKNALLEGSWDSFSGQVFTEWRDDPQHYLDRRWTHVIAPFDIPRHWRIYRGFDFGYAAPFAVGWFAVDEDGIMYHFREYYGCGRDPNTGVRLDPHRIAAEIAKIEREDPNLAGRDIIGIADPAIFAESTGESIARQMEHEGVFFSRGDHQRIAGKMQMHYRFAFDERGKPMMYVFNTCRNFIRTVPDLVYDERNVEDVDTNGEDHIYDMARYVAMEHPIRARRNAAPPKRDAVSGDPLDLRERPSRTSINW